MLYTKLNTSARLTSPTSIAQPYLNRDELRPEASDYTETVSTLFSASSHHLARIQIKQLCRTDTNTHMQQGHCQTTPCPPFSKQTSMMTGKDSKTISLVYPGQPAAAHLLPSLYKRAPSPLLLPTRRGIQQTASQISQACLAHRLQETSQAKTFGIMYD